MGDGGALAFFSFGDPDVYNLVIAEKPPNRGIEATSAADRARTTPTITPLSEPECFRVASISEIILNCPGNSL
jgi:hypothetical protein